MTAPDADWIVVGSGFGGSVAALRLAQKGHRVIVLEQGRRWADHEFATSQWQLSKAFWRPEIGWRGPLRASLHRDVTVVSGVGVGGGSLVYGNTLYRARPAFYADPQWAALGDWEAELAPHYEAAERMLGVLDAPATRPADRLLREYAETVGRGDTWRPTRIGVFLGAPGETVADPFFGGDGPARTGCTHCGACHLGCRVGAKNTLTKNYLHLAERLGARVLPGREAVDVRAAGAGYEVTVRRPGRPWARRTRLRAAGVVLAAGTEGTNLLLARSRAAGSLPRVSPRLGHLVRTNSESIPAVTAPDDALGLGAGIAITSSMHPDEDTHIEVDTWGRGADAMSLTYTLLAGPGSRVTRPLRWAGRALRHPRRFAATLSPRGWGRRSTYLLVMQTLDNAIRLEPRRGLLGGVRLRTRQDPERPVPAHIPAADAAAEWMARRVGGVAQSPVAEALLSRPTTAHFLGGAVIGAGPQDGVIDARHRVFGYENLLVCDGAALPANPGVNPSLTITAMAERALSFVPAETPAPVPATAAT